MKINNLIFAIISLTVSGCAFTMIEGTGNHVEYEVTDEIGVTHESKPCGEKS